ncbi:MAG: rod shape-determining protein MreD [Acidobacteriota bacterium]|jgi:rod shape-determining protein MreD
MKYLFLGLSAFLAIVAQMIAGNNFFLFNFLDMALILVAYWAVYRSRMQALFVGSLTGLLLDAAIGWPLGYNGFGKTLAAFAIGQCWKRFNTADQLWVRFSIIAASSCLSSLSMFVLFLLLERSSSKIYLGASLLQAFVTAAVAVIIFAGLENYKRTQTNKAH